MIGLDDLVLSATQSANRRGHILGNWTKLEVSGRSLAETICTKCAMRVTVDTKPSPNETAIAGEAVALNCPGKKKSQPGDWCTGGRVELVAMVPPSEEEPAGRELYGADAFVFLSRILASGIIHRTGGTDVVEEMYRQLSDFKEEFTAKCVRGILEEMPGRLEMLYQASILMIADDLDTFKKGPRTAAGGRIRKDSAPFRLATLLRLAKETLEEIEGTG